MNKKVDDRQFYLRVLLVLGMIWGLQPLIALLFIFHGANNTPFYLLTAVLNALTILPACILAFWHRRLACVWLTINAGLVITSMTLFICRNHDDQVGNIIGAIISVLLAVFLDVAEARRWPGALEKLKP